jgi:hypothetical protein
MAASAALNLPRYNMSRYNARTPSRRAATACGDMSISSWVIIVGTLELGQIDEILRTPGGNVEPCELRDRHGIGDLL